MEFSASEAPEKETLSAFFCREAQVVKIAEDSVVVKLRENYVCSTVRIARPSRSPGRDDWTKRVERRALRVGRRRPQSGERQSHCLAILTTTNNAFVPPRDSVPRGRHKRRVSLVNQEWALYLHLWSKYSDHSHHRRSGSPAL